MLIMENSEEIMQILERYTKLKSKDIPKELEDYLCYVAKTGDTVYRWSHVKYLFREKLMNVIKEFHDTTPSIDDLPQYPNVDPFNYETMKSALLERVDLFSAAPFTIQRLCELLTDPRKQYSRIDKYMRALEKNILVVSTIEPGRKQPDSENGDSLDSVVNGDISLDVNVEIDMESESIFTINPPNITTASTSLKSELLESLSESDAKRAKLEVDENNEVDENQDVYEKNLENTKQSFVISKTEEREQLSEEENSESKSDSSLKEHPSEVTNFEQSPDSHETSTKSSNIQENLITTESEKVVAEQPQIEKVIVPENKLEISNESTNDGEIITDDLKPIISQVSDTETINSTALITKIDQHPKDSQEPAETETDSSKIEVIVSNLPIDTDKKIIEPSSEPEEDSLKDNIAAVTTADTTNIATVLKVPEQMSVEETAALVSDTSECAPIPVAAVSADPPIVPDQPMDENVDPAVPTTSQPDGSCLNEISMQTETEMSTDPDIGKADQAIMDVDDTSQEEAMDQ